MAKEKPAKETKEEVKEKTIKVLLTKDYFANVEGKEFSGKKGQEIELPVNHYNRKIKYYKF